MEEFENAGILKKEVNPGLDKILNTTNRPKTGVTLEKSTLTESGTVPETSTMPENPTTPIAGAMSENPTVPLTGAMPENPTAPITEPILENPSPQFGNNVGSTNQTDLSGPATTTEAGSKKADDKVDAYPGTTPESEKGDEPVPYIKCDSLVRIFKSEGIEVMALQGLDLEIQKGELMAIIGKSGSGKSTLLNLLGALDKPSAGYIAYDGVNIAELSSSKLAEFRNKHI